MVISNVNWLTGVHIWLTVWIVEFCLLSVAKPNCSFDSTIYMRKWDHLVTSSGTCNCMRCRH